MTQSIRKIDNISVTYYVNPQLFYFKYEVDESSDDTLSRLNDSIEKYVHKHIESRRSYAYSPQIGEIVLCHYISDCISKWIRVRVDNKFTYGKEKFTLWAIDYGFPLESEPRWIRKLLSEELKTVEDGLIFKAGLFNIIPATVEWNAIESAEQTWKTKKWSTKAIAMVERYIHEADSITFQCRAFYKDHYFGSLIVRTNTGTKIVIEDFLRNARECLDSIKFVKEFSALDHSAYWERQQQDAIFKIYENNSDQNMSVFGDSVSHLSTSNYDLFIKSKVNPKLKLTEDDENGELEETPMELVDRLPVADNVFLRRGKPVQSNSCAGSISETSSKPVDTKDIIDKVRINVVPMNKRLEIAQQKLLEKGKVAAAKQARIDEIDKKLMGLKFPAGYIVDDKAVKEKLAEKSNRGKKASDKNGESKKNPFNFQKAQEFEECFTINHKQHILVHDHDNFPKSPIKDISEAHFSQEVHAALKYLNYNQIYRIQTIGWPTIMRGSSLIVVGAGNTGKTWTYLPAICSLIIERIEDGRVVSGCGPLSIIACTSSREVEKITKHCQDLLRHTNPAIRCVQAYGFHDDKVVSQLLNGSEILIATIPRLHRLMAHELQLFNKERIINFVFDNIDLVYEQFSREIGEIYKALCDPVKSKQTIVTSRTWHKILDMFYKESSDVTLCIGAYIEAAVYARSEFILKLFKQEFKFDSLISYLSEEKYRSELTLVICNEPEDVTDLLMKLQSTSIKIWYCHDKSDSSDIKKIKNMIETANSGDFNALICTDDVLLDLDIRRAQHIIHFSLPSTWTKFTFRFSVFLNYHENLFAKKASHKPVATSLVFLDENNNEQLPRLIEFMQLRVNANVPEDIQKFAEAQRIKNEEHRFNVYKPFCNNLLTIGVCHGRLTCQHRHILTKFDKSRGGIPRNGFVKFEIIAIHTPAHYTVRLLEHRVSNLQKWSKLQSTDDFLSFNMEFTNYFENIDNQTIHSPCNLGDLCVVCIDSEIGASYHRGKIMKIEEKTQMGILNKVIIEVLLVDSNGRYSCNSTDLMQLPERFQKYPHQAVDVRIAEIRPRDFDSEWDKKSLMAVKNWIQSDKDHYIQGNIKLSIMDTLWVDSVEVIEILNSLRFEVHTISIKRKLLEQKFGEKDSKTMQLLISLAEKSDFNAQDEQDIHSPYNFAATQIVDLRKSTDLLFRSNSCSSMIDVDDSEISRLNWTTSSDGDNDEYIIARDTCLESSELNGSIHSSASSTAESEKELRESKDKWAELTVNQFNKIALGTFYHPGRVYIRNMDSSSRTRMFELNKRIDDFTSISENLKVLSNIALAGNCFAKIDEKFHRAKIIKIDDASNTVEVMFVDFGEILYLPINELFEIPKNFITALPFQAIFCKFIGIRPSNNTPEWGETVCDDIYDNILNKHRFFYARPMKTGKLDKYIYGLKCRSYEVVLVDGTGDMNINKVIVSSQYGELNPDSNHFIDIIVDKSALKPSSDDSSEDSDYVDCNDGIDDQVHHSQYNSELEGDFSYKMDIEFDEEDIKKWFQESQIPISFEKAIQPVVEVEEFNNEAPPPVVIEEIFEETTHKGVNRPSIIDPEIDSSTLSQLGSLYKSPNIQWHQSDDIIVLTIHAPDVIDYYLKVTPKLVYLCYEKAQEKFAAVLNLFGCIDVEHTSHEIRGLNIVIRLAKTFYRLPWPRLLTNKIKCNWIHYNFEADLGAFNELRTDLSLKTTRHISCNDDMDSSENENEAIDDFDFDNNAF